MPTLLLVEDDDDIRDTLADVLRHKGYEVVEAENGKIALDKLLGGVRPALILLDQTMPVMNGREFRRAQLEDPSLAQIPVLLMTAANAIGELVDEMHPQFILRKPMGLQELFQTLNAALDPNSQKPSKGEVA